MTPGARIKDARVALGLTQHDLAEASGVSQATISLIENDRQEPRISTTRKLAEVLRSDPVWLMFGQFALPPSHLPQGSGAYREWWPDPLPMDGVEDGV